MFLMSIHQRAKSNFLFPSRYKNKASHRQGIKKKWKIPPRETVFAHQTFLLLLTLLFLVWTVILDPVVVAAHFDRF